MVASVFSVAAPQRKAACFQMGNLPDKVAIGYLNSFIEGYSGERPGLAAVANTILAYMGERTSDEYVLSIRRPAG